MTRSHIVALLALIAAVPAAALGGKSFMGAENTPCFSTGSISYRITSKPTADYTIKIDNAALRPDLTLQLVNDPGQADFVLADGADDPGECTGAIRTIRLDPIALEPDLTVALTPYDGPARYRIFAHSSDFSAQDAAALFAVMAQAGRKSAVLRNLGTRNDDITGALGSPSTRVSKSPRQ
jgi:hypothetical protein